MNVPVRIATAVFLAVSGYFHAQLYVGGYRVIPVIGPAFLVQAAASFAVALLLVLGGPWLLRVAAAGLAAGSLAGFALSRTTGLFGFSETGFQPAPQALLSLLSEMAVLVLVGVFFARQNCRWRVFQSRREERSETTGRTARPAHPPADTAGLD